MFFSFTAFITVLFFSSALIILIWLFLKNNRLIKEIGVGSLFFCIAIIMIRLFIPVEFTFANNLAFKRVLPKIVFFFEIPIIASSNYNICFHHVIYVIWLIGAIIQLSRILQSYKHFKRTISKLPVVKDVHVQNTLQKTLQNYNESVNFKIVQTDMISTPMILGVLKPWIVVPQLEFSQNEWHYILSHEIAHYYHGDLWVKIIIEFLCIIYWWNPFIYLLKKQVSKVLEIHTDLTITKSMDELERIEYLECLLKIAKYNANRQLNKLALTFDSESTSMLSQRFHIVLENSNQKEKFRFKSIFLTIPILFLVVLSFFFVFEPYFILPNDAYGTVEITNENSYLIQNQDNTYDLYINDQFFGTVNEIKDSYANLVIYKNIREVQNYEKN